MQEAIKNDTEVDQEHMTIYRKKSSVMVNTPVKEYWEFSKAKQLLERFKHVNADGETVYTIDAAPAYQKLRVSNSAIFMVNPFAAVTADDATTDVTAYINGFYGDSA